MARLVFDQDGQKLYEAGVENGVLFMGSPKTAKTVTGVAWNGLTSVAQSPDGGDENAQYADNIKYVSLRGEESQQGTIECFKYPAEFERCLGHQGLVGKDAEGKLIYHSVGPLAAQQKKEPFSFAYLTKVGNDEEGLEHSEKLHIIYNATVSPAEKTHESIGDSPEAITFSLEYACTPVKVDTSKIVWGKTITAENNKFKPTSVIELERTGTDEEIAFYDEIKDMVYGKDGEGAADSHLPLPHEVFNAYIQHVDKAEA